MNRITPKSMNAAIRANMLGSMILISRAETAAKHYIKRLHKQNNKIVAEIIYPFGKKKQIKTGYAYIHTAFQYAAVSKVTVCIDTDIHNVNNCEYMRFLNETFTPVNGEYVLFLNKDKTKSVTCPVENMVVIFAVTGDADVHIPETINSLFPKYEWSLFA